VAGRATVIAVRWGPAVAAARYLSSPAVSSMVLALGTGLLLACAASTPAPTLEPAFPGQVIVVVEVGQGRFHALVADTPELRDRGLSERDTLPEGWGMWFDLGSKRVATFWMRAMLFPIDMVWVDEQMRVVHVDHQVSVLPDGASEESLPRYRGGSHLVRYVLEIGAGLARELEIEPGVDVRLMQTASEDGS
jgi:uncharacterized membrane protein (UPF0127 family)